MPASRTPLLVEKSLVHEHSLDRSRSLHGVRNPGRRNLPSRRVRGFTGWLVGFLLLVLLPLPVFAVLYVMTTADAAYPAVSPFGTDTSLEDDGFYPIS